MRTIKERRVGCDIGYKAVNLMALIGSLLCDYPDDEVMFDVEYDETNEEFVIRFYIK